MVFNSSAASSVVIAAPLLLAAELLEGEVGPLACLVKVVLGDLVLVGVDRQDAPSSVPNAQTDVQVDRIDWVQRSTRKHVEELLQVRLQEPMVATYAPS